MQPNWRTRAHYNLFFIHSQHFNEILPLTWSRFHESEARQWRQIYKVCILRVSGSCSVRSDSRMTFLSQALTLLEYLVKNGSERVVDDARGHIATVKMLKNFQYTDEKAKDQGINGETGYSLLAVGS